jgi:hypothetical protein
MRFRLRTLLIFAVIAPALLFVLWLLVQLGVEVGRIVEPLPRQF